MRRPLLSRPSSYAARSHVAGAVVGMCALIAASGCSGGDDQPGGQMPKTGSRLQILEEGVDYRANAVGFGEALDTAGGHQRILSMTDPGPAHGVDVPDGSRVVTGLLEECASVAGPVTAGSAGWTAVTKPRGSAPISVATELQPTDEGAPSIDATRTLGAGTCAMGDLVFVVPDDVAVLGFHYEGGGRSRTGTWIKAKGYQP